MLRIKLLVDEEKLRQLRRKGFVLYRRYHSVYDYLNCSSHYVKRRDFEECMDYDEPLTSFTGIILKDNCIGNVIVHGNHVHVFKTRSYYRYERMTHKEAMEILRSLIEMLEKHNVKCTLEEVSE